MGGYDWHVAAPPSFVCTEEDEKNYVYDPTRPREYGTEIRYVCPVGHVFDTSALDLPSVLPQENEITFTCGSDEMWWPPMEPKCVSKWPH